MRRSRPNCRLVGRAGASLRLRKALETLGRRPEQVSAAPPPRHPHPGRGAEARLTLYSNARGMVVSVRGTRRRVCWRIVVGAQGRRNGLLRA
jgi:hypothetical protein